jgi:hypothetical protein
MAAVVHGTGAALRLATDAEARAVAAAAGGGEFSLTPPRSFAFAAPERPPGDDETLVVCQAFVDVDHRGVSHRCHGPEHHGQAVSTVHEASLDLLRLAGEAREDMLGILGDLRIAGMRVSRWQLMSAPSRIELEPDLARRLAPLRRG